MVINSEALALIKISEGFKLEAYKCPADVWTIGYGHTKGVKPGMRITASQADKFLDEDIAEASKQINKVVKVPLNNNQFSALVSFVFNLGIGNFSKSTLLKKINNGDFKAASLEFGKWVYSGGKKLKGLERRRTAEKRIFLS